MGEGGGSFQPRDRAPARAAGGGMGGGARGGSGGASWDAPRGGGSDLDDEIPF
jgi:single-strand DNA-binding protein